MSDSIDYFNKQHPLMRWQTRASVRMRTRMFESVPIRAGMRVLEVGATPDTTLADSNLFSKLAKKSGCEVWITSPEDCSRVAQSHGFHWLPFDRYLAGAPDVPVFDVVVSSAVLEHVGGGREDKIRHLELLKTNAAGLIVVATPNRFHWLEFHTKLPFLHWLPKPAHRRLLRMIGMKTWAEPGHLDLMSPGEFRACLAAAYPGAEIASGDFYFLGMRSNLFAVVSWGDSKRGS